MAQPSIGGGPYDNRRLTEPLTNETIAFFRRYHQRPFLIYLPFTAVHFPVQTHPEWVRHSKNAEYGDVLEELDARIGTVMETLQELGIERDILLVFTSDNGPENGTKDMTKSRNVAKGHPELVKNMLERARSLVDDIARSRIPIASEVDRAIVPSPARSLTRP